VLQALSPHLLGVEQARVWPGTELSDSLATRHLFHLDERSLGILGDSAAGLFEWVNPGLPEDLHFLRLDGSTVLGSVAQEEDAWLELSDEELAGWRHSAGSLLNAAIAPHSEV